ncbi:hypothetical protein VM1G_06414 [Cytospora mali]|uniref:Uncharacterized protein n=1 Tax=Cytospora mali TaxID=578113 RepID=A0A194W3P1_CYTMA|nr:hypothetical protein VM1G_06414 [Valsa mali]
MDKKQAAPSPHLTQPNRRITIAGIALPLAIILLFSFLRFQSSVRRQPVQRQEQSHYEGELITWVPCGEAAGHPLECSKITVPMDHFAPQNLTRAVEHGHIFTIPLIRMRSKNATESIFINPGGPGGSGVGFLYHIGEELNAIIGEGYHILSFDPRGVNGSSPKAECYPDEQTRRTLSRLRTGRLEDSGEIYSWTKNFVQACYDTMGEHAKYINTPQTAADMNYILDSIGQKDMIYWGFSYGTLLGQTYATMYPERSKRIIIDGVGNLNNWYGRLDHEQEWCTDTENVLQGFFDECMKAGSDNCPLAAFGSTGGELWDAVFSFLDKLKDEPLSVYVNNTIYGLFDYTKVLRDGIFAFMYSPQKQWYFAADSLAKLLQGNATDAFMVYGRGDAFSAIREASQIVMFNDGKTGPAYWSQGRQELLDEIVPLANYSVFSMIDVPNFFGRQQWIVPHTHKFVPQRRVRTAHPLLILSTTYDPGCPLVSAQAAKEMFEGSQIVEVKTYGHCSNAMPSVCVARHVRAYLYEGKLPEKHTQCDVEGDYFIKPGSGDDGETMEAMGWFGDEDMDQIHLAQVRLARK